MSKTKTIAKATGLIMGFSILSKLLAVVREQAVAAYFGATGSTDAYVAALSIPTLIFVLFGVALGTAFLPVFTDYLATGRREEGWKVARSVFNLTFLILGMILIIGVIAAPLITSALVPNMSGDKLDLTVTLMRILLPIAVFMGLASLFSAALNAYMHFTTPAIGPALTNVFIIGTIFLFGRRYGIQALAWGTVLGMFAQMAVMFPALRRKQFRMGVEIDWRHPGVRKVVKLSIPVLIGTLFTKLYLLVDKNLASGLAEGSIAALNFGQRLMDLPLSVFVMAFSTVLFPVLSEQAIKGDKAGLAKTLAMGLRLVALVTIPATVGLIVLRVPIVKLLFERGAFDSGATAATAAALMFYAVGILGHSTVAVVSRAYYALQDMHTPLKITIFSSILNIALDFILVRYLAHSGLALANSLAVLTNAALSYAILTRKLGNLDNRTLLWGLIKILLASAAMGVSTVIIFAYTNHISLLFRLVLAVGGGVVVYLAGAALLRIEEVAMLKKMVRSRSGKANPASEQGN